MIQLTSFLLLFTVTAFSNGVHRPSTVSGLTIGNAHQVDPSGLIFRGKEPDAKVGELVRFGINHVIILKPDQKGEIAREKAVLTQNQIQITHIPMKWDESTPVLTCEQTVQAVNAAIQARAQGKKVFIHCASGEDRTGIVSGLIRMKLEGWKAQNAYTNEMCGNGYQDGDPEKPAQINRYIQSNLTPVFLLLSRNIENGIPLTPALCKNILDPALQQRAKGMSCHQLAF